MSPSVASRAPDTTPHLFQSPALLTDAIKRLSAAVRDRQSVSSERKRADDASGGGSRGATNVFRIMDNLFTFSHGLAPSMHPGSAGKVRRVSENSRQTAEEDFQVLQTITRRSSVFIKSAEGVLGVPDPEVAARYVMTGTGSGRSGSFAEMAEMWKERESRQHSCCSSRSRSDRSLKLLTCASCTWSIVARPLRR